MYAAVTPGSTPGLVVEITTDAVVHTGCIENVIVDPLGVIDWQLPAVGLKAPWLDRSVGPKLPNVVVEAGIATDARG